MRGSMVRFGKFPGTRLGLGTIANTNLADSKLYFTILTATTSATSLQLTQGQTKMAAIRFAAIFPFGVPSAKATASLEFRVPALGTSGWITSGTIKFVEKTNTLARNVRCMVFLVGTGDPNRVPT